MWASLLASRWVRVKVTAARAMASAATSLVKSGATGAFINSGMQAIQSISPDVAKAISSPDFATVFNDPAKRQQFISDTLNAAEQGAALFPMMEMPGHAAPVEERAA